MYDNLLCSMAKVSGTGDLYERLFYSLDNKNGGYGLVDYVPGFSWYREKSNDTVRDPRRGFSFYYARLVYKDDFHLELYDSLHSTDNDHRWQIIGHPFRLEHANILMVVETDRPVIPGKTHLISAMIVTDPSILKQYNDNKIELIQQSKRNRDHLKSLYDKMFPMKN